MPSSLAAVPLERIGTAVWKRVANARNRRFETSLRRDPSGPLVVLSPHLDDAVLDCWSVLTGPGEVQVVNVFALAPPPGTSTDWDRIVGVPDSEALFAARIEEDAEALALAGRTAHNLPFLEIQYRRGKPFPSWADIDREIAGRVPAAARVLAPMTIGTVHPDHALLRAYALELALQGHDVSLYADVPYSTVYGWPAWVTGSDPDPHLDVDAYWAPSFDGAPVAPREGRVTRLDDEVAARKLEAMRAYRTQFPSLDRGPIGNVSNPEVHRYEVMWEVPR
jgi:LmbE family N-acetylglucosaminyl deacetylase